MSRRLFSASRACPAAQRKTPHAQPAQLRTFLRFLHRWVGFPAALLLVVMFFSGALSIFNMDLQAWMQPSTVEAGLLSDKGMQAAETAMNTAAQQNAPFFLRLPDQHDPALRLWRYDGHVFRGPMLDPATGRELTAPPVVGGTFFVTLHDSFHLLSPWGDLLVAVLGLCFLLALGTGLALQWKRLVMDFLLFRPQASAPRSWLDLHLLTGTLGFPVLLLIGLSGGTLAALRLLPPAPVSLPAQTVQPTTHYQALLHEGEQHWGAGHTGFILLEPHNPAPSGPARFQPILYESDTARFCLQRDHISASGQAVLSPPATCSFSGFVRGVHDLRWADDPLRWLYFFTAVTGWLLLASALVLFLKSERRKATSKKTAAKPVSSYWLRLVQTLVVGMLAGLPLATFGLFWATRLPSPLPDPIFWQEMLFSGLWGSCFLFAALSQKYAHALTLGALSALGLGLPFLDFATRPFSLASVFLLPDLLGFMAGGCALFLLCRSPPTAKAKSCLPS